MNMFEGCSVVVVGVYFECVFLFQVQMVVFICDGGQLIVGIFVLCVFVFDQVLVFVRFNIFVFGFYCIFINGKCVGDDLLIFGWICYDDCIVY